jgi:hypothetical protein
LAQELAQSMAVLFLSLPDLPVQARKLVALYQ